MAISRSFKARTVGVHISCFVTHRTSTLPFLLKVPALLAIKLVCLWFLWLAKHIIKWWDMPSYLTQDGVPGDTPLYGIYRYMQLLRVRFSAVLVINRLINNFFQQYDTLFLSDWPQTMGFNVTMLKDMYHHFEISHKLTSYKRTWWNNAHVINLFKWFIILCAASTSNSVTVTKAFLLEKKKLIQPAALNYMQKDSIAFLFNFC